jgi:hypothetical protein
VTPFVVEDVVAIADGRQCCNSLTLHRVQYDEACR